METKFIIRVFSVVFGVVLLSCTRLAQGNGTESDYYAYTFIGLHEQVVIRENNEIRKGDLVYEWSNECPGATVSDVRCFYSRVIDLSIPSREDVDVGYHWMVGPVKYELVSRDLSVSLFGQERKLFTIEVTRQSNPDKKLDVTCIYYSPPDGVIGFKVNWAGGGADVALLMGEQGLWSETSFVE